MTWCNQRVLLVAAWALAVFAAGSIRAQPAGSSFVVRHVRVFDGEQVRPDTNVVVDAGVVRVVDQQIPDHWRNLPVVDGTGATLLPGLIDAHTRTRRVSQLQMRTELNMASRFPPYRELMRRRRS